MCRLSYENAFYTRETETEKFGSKKKNEKKKRKRGRERRSVARPTTTRESRGPVFVVVSFLFRLNLFLFFFVRRRESRLIQTHLVSRARIFISSSLRAEYQHQHQHHRTHASTRAPFVVGKSFGKSSESRGEVREEQKRKSGNRSRVREGGNGDWKRRGIDEKNQHQRGLEEDKELVEQ